MPGAILERSFLPSGTVFIDDARDPHIVALPTGTCTPAQMQRRIMRARWRFGWGPLLVAHYGEIATDPKANLADLDAVFSFAPTAGKNDRHERYWRSPRLLDHIAGREALAPDSLWARPKTRFCNFVYSNTNFSDTSVREGFARLLMRNGDVDCPGRVLNNTSPLPLNESGSKAGLAANLEYQSSCRFTIAFENTSADHYVTEKIVHAFCGGSRTASVAPGTAALRRENTTAIVRSFPRCLADVCYSTASQERMVMQRQDRATVGAAQARTDVAQTAGTRYLRYDEVNPVPVGINHQTRNLEVLMREAHSVDRLAVLPTLKLAPHHNFGVDRQWRWETYYDFGKSTLVDSFGKNHPLPLTFNAPDPDLGALTLTPKVRIPASAAGHALVARRITTSVHARDVPFAAHGPPVFQFSPSPRILTLARHVVAELRARGGGQFAAVHVRRGDRLLGPMKRLTSPPRIRALLQAKNVPDGAVVFFLSDERNASFWEQLRPHYALVRYTDLANLQALVSPSAGGKPDDYLLYEVEKQIMRHAFLRIETFPGPEYEPSDSTLVPQTIWTVARFARRSKHAGTRLVHRLPRLVRGIVGPRAWTAAKWLAAALRRRAAP